MERGHVPSVCRRAPAAPAAGGQHEQQQQHGNQHQQGNHHHQRCCSQLALPRVPPSAAHASLAVAAPAPAAGKQDIAPLAALDHGALHYADFAKDFYTPVAELAALSPAEVAARRRALGIRVSGFDVPAPVQTFSQVRCHVVQCVPGGHVPGPGRASPRAELWPGGPPCCVAAAWGSCLGLGLGLVAAVPWALACPPPPCTVLQPGGEGAVACGLPGLWAGETVAVVAVRWEWLTWAAV